MFFPLSHSHFCSSSGERVVKDVNGLSSVSFSTCMSSKDLPPSAQRYALRLRQWTAFQLQ